MVMVDVFMVRRLPYDGSRALSVDLAEEFRRSMDLDAPLPWVGVCPEGGLVLVFAVDFHRSPAAVCTRMGVDYVHVCYMEADRESYTPLNELVLRSYSWVRIFLKAWDPQGSVSGLHVTQYQQHAHP
jgi:hypothetical protein